MPRAVALLALFWTACATAPVAPPAAPEAVPAEPAPDWAALAAARLPGLEVCELPGVAEPVLCGTIEVLENRNDPDGRRIGLKVVVVPAQQEAPPDDPVFILEGGPGGAVTGRAGGSIWAGPVRRRDIVLVDQRGTGGSGLLDCDLDSVTPDRPGSLSEMFPPAAVAACAEELSARADLSLYTSAQHAADLEEVRQRLGYGPLNLRGGSYGTRAAMVYAQLYPENTRTLFGIGVDSPLRSNLAERGQGSERTLDGLAAFCAAEPDCATLVPDLGAAVRSLVATLDAGSRRVELADPTRPGERLELDVDRDWLTENLRLVLYFAFTSRTLPWAVHRVMEADDWEPLVQIALVVQRMFESSLATGVLLTVQCSEHMDFDFDAALEKGRDGLFGNYRLEQQIQGCAAWPHRKQPPLVVPEPAVLEIRALWLSGALDPVTPAVYADEAATLFPNSRHVVLAEGQHGPFDLEESWVCVHGLWAQLLDGVDPAAIDASCTEAMRRPPFLVDEESFRTYLTDELAPMAQ